MVSIENISVSAERQIIVGEDGYVNVCDMKGGVKKRIKGTLFSVDDYGFFVKDTNIKTDMHRHGWDGHYYPNLFARLELFLQKSVKMEVMKQFRFNTSINLRPNIEYLDLSNSEFSRVKSILKELGHYYLDTKWKDRRFFLDGENLIILSNFLKYDYPYAIFKREYGYDIINVKGQEEWERRSIQIGSEFNIQSLCDGVIFFGSTDGTLRSLVYDIEADMMFEGQEINVSDGTDFNIPRAVSNNEYPIYKWDRTKNAFKFIMKVTSKTPVSIKKQTKDFIAIEKTDVNTDKLIYNIYASMDFTFRISAEEFNIIKDGSVYENNKIVPLTMLVTKNGNTCNIYDRIGRTVARIENVHEMKVHLKRYIAIQTEEQKSKNEPCKVDFYGCYGNLLKSFDVIENQEMSF